MQEVSIEYPLKRVAYPDRKIEVLITPFPVLIIGAPCEYLFKEIIEGGHSSGADLKQRAQSEAFQYTYLTRKLMD